MEKPTILIVDDERNNIKILNQIFDDKYTIRVALNGSDALERSLIIPIPDLILLDIMMPGKNGYETSRQLKLNPETKHIPIIFITAKTETDDIVKGFESGAVDYITKPFNREELVARVSTHLELKLSREKVHKQKEELIKASAIRDNVDRIINHDLKTPLNAILGFSPILLEEETLTQDGQGYLRLIIESGNRILDMVNLSQDLFNMERGVYQLQAVSVDILQIIGNIVSEVDGLRKKHKAHIKIIVSGHPQTDDDKIMIQGNELFYHMMLVNLVKNAIEASPEEGNVTIDVDKKESTVLRIHNERAVPESIRNKFFEKYTTSGKAQGTGLGTYSAKLITEAQNGKISMKTSEDKGTTITVEFPHV